MSERLYHCIVGAGCAPGPIRLNVKDAGDAWLRVMNRAHPALAGLDLNSIMRLFSARVAYGTTRAALAEATVERSCGRYGRGEWWLV